MASSAGLGFLLLAALAGAGLRGDDSIGLAVPDFPIVFAQASVALADERSRIVRLEPGGAISVLTERFYSAREPDISFDGNRILFSAKEKADDRWQIYEMAADGSDARRITAEAMDCRQPGYQSYFYVITADRPWSQITFVGSSPLLPANLYSSKLDGTGVRQLTFNPYGVSDPHLMPDGRILFSSRQSNRLEPGPRDRAPLFGVNLDGADYALYSGEEGERWKRMPTVTPDGLAVFVEAAERAADGSDAWRQSRCGGIFTLTAN